LGRSGIKGIDSEQTFKSIPDFGRLAWEENAQAEVVRVELE